MGNANTNNNQITINTKYTNIENLIKDFRKYLDALKSSKIKSFEEYEKSENNKKIKNIQEEINKEIMKLRTSTLNNSTNINEYTNSSIKLKKYIFDIQKITKEYFETIKNKTKYFINIYNIIILFNFI